MKKLNKTQIIAKTTLQPMEIPDCDAKEKLENMPEEPG